MKRLRPVLLAVLALAPSGARAQDYSASFEFLPNSINAGGNNFIATTTNYLNIISHNDPGSTVRVEYNTVLGGAGFLGGLPFPNIEFIDFAFPNAENGENKLVMGLTDNHQLTVTVSSGAFDDFVDLTVFQLDPLIFKCPRGLPVVGFEVFAQPAAQPRKPIEFELTVQHFPRVDLDGKPRGELSIQRQDARGSPFCVPLETRYNPSTRKITFRTNHISLFHLTWHPPENDLIEARIFPNPFRPSRWDGYVTVDKLTADARVRIFTLRGEKVFDRQATGSGIVRWDGVNPSGRVAASGIYIVHIASSKGERFLKLAVTR